MNFIKLPISNYQYIKIIYKEIDIQDPSCTRCFIEYIDKKKNQSIIFGYDFLSSIIHFLSKSDQFKNLIKGNTVLDTEINLGLQWNNYYQGITKKESILFMFHFYGNAHSKQRPYYNSWIYNDINGNIILEITPFYPWHRKTKKEFPEKIPYKQWIQEYQSAIKIIIEKKYVNQWINELTNAIKEEINGNKIMSDSIDQLATALAKAQLEMKAAVKNQKNPFFKSSYADFESIKEATVPYLAKYGLSVTQPPVTNMDSGNSYLVTLLIHASGQWIKSEFMYNPPKSDVQSLSSYNTYLKRMCYTNIVGVATSENDDDGEATMQRNYAQTTYTPEHNIITGYQHTVLMNLLVQAEEGKEKQICAHYGITDLTKLPASKYNEVKNRIEPKK